MVQNSIKLEDSPISHAPPGDTDTAPSQTSTMAASTPPPGADFTACDGRPFGQGADHNNVAQIDLLGRPVQKLVELIKELETLGVETKDLPLPKIVVVGDQSAGKSSLIEGLSGIKVPRSDGTCTRCPLQIALYSAPSDGATWSCKVSLQQKFSFNPNADAIAQGRYGKWREDHTPTTVPFAVVDDREALAGVISRAQWATLNPGDDPIRYLNAESVESMPMKVEFSPNKVILDITAPGQPSLSFIDLPGVIRQMTTAKDKWLVNLVENFVSDHIKQENSLILLARSMESDFANSSGAALIDQYDGALNRTVGCLTKPDRWPPGTKTQILQSVLCGDAFAVGHGYFVTKQPDQLQLNNNISSEESRRKEDEFFSQAPWSTELRSFQDRFGTFKLRDTLSNKLTQQILVTLPDITRTVDTHLQEIEAELAGYPDPPENALGKVLEALNVFRASVDKHAHGIHPHNDMRNSLKELANTFHRNLHKLRPGLIITTPEGYRQAISIPTFSLLSDDEDPTGTPCPSVEPTQNGKKRRNNFVDTPASASSSKKIKTDTVNNLRGNPIVATGKKTFRLMDMRDTLSKLTASGVPGEVDPLAVDYLRKETLAGWEPPMLEFINSVNQEIQGTLDQLLEEACSQWLNTAFFSEAKKIVKAFISNAMRCQLEHAKRALIMEQRKPLTLNEEGLKYHHDRELQILQDGRTTQRLVEKLESADHAAGRILVDQTERKKKAKTDLKARADLGDDPFDQEIRVMGKVRGYHDVALLRFLDHVVQGVQVEVLHDLEHHLPQQLKTGLEVETCEAHERCKELLAEDRKRELHRKELQKERANFIEAQHKLARIGRVGDDV